jgi:hypothetical protein
VHGVLFHLMPWFALAGLAVYGVSAAASGATAPAALAGMAAVLGIRLATGMIHSPGGKAR